MSLVDTIVRVSGRQNDIQRRLLMAEGSRCFLLKRAGETSKFKSVAELTSGWVIEFNEYRAQFTLYYADTLGTFKDLIGQTSFIAFGEGASLAVYSIDPDRRDVIEPTVENAMWKVYVTRVATERYVPS